MSAGSETTYGGDKSAGRFFAKNRLRIPCIVDFLAIFGEKSPLSLQRDLTAQITPVLIQRPDLNPNVNKEIQRPNWFQIVIRRPDLNPNVNKEIQRPDCFQIVIQRPKLILNGNLRFQRLFWPKFHL